MADQRIEKWERWFEHGISSDVYTMHLQRFAWKRMEQITQANPDLNGTPSYLWEFLFETYAKTQAGAVRRQADVDDQAASLGRLIYEIEQTPTLLTRDWWLSLGGNGQQRRRPLLASGAEKAWTDQFGGQVGDYLDPAIPQVDLAKLRDGSEKVRRYVDQNVAHLDARAIPNLNGPPTGAPPEAPTTTGEKLPTLNEVHDAIDLIGDLFKKYGNLLTAAAWVDLTPALQHDWEAVFRVPWIRKARRPSTAE